MKFERRFTTADRPVAEQVEWEVREASIPGAGFHMEVEVPKAWSQDATNVFAQKYLRKAGVPHAIEPVYQTFQTSETIPSPPKWLLPSKAIEDEGYGAETSALQVFHRMVGCWTYWGWREGYFWQEKPPKPYLTKDAEESARVFYNELFWMLAHQYAAPNSPQWFNTGLWWAYGIEGPDTGQWAIVHDYPIADGGQTADVIDRVFNSYERPQVHACYIQPVADTLVGDGGMLDLWAKEARLFKHGSGTGTNFSSIRARGEALSGGGYSSGLMSFLRVGDANAGSIKSGGVTRRAAKMCVLDLDHPEIEAFIGWKVREEAKAAAMYVGSRLLHKDPNLDLIDEGVVPTQVTERIAAGFEPEVFAIDGMEAEAIASVDGQNSNNSVRVPDSFLRIMDQDLSWNLINRVDGKVKNMIPARNLWNRSCRAAWACGDPGLQFSDTINAWHTCPNDGEIRASNPCSEYLFLDNTACNLASLNLCKFMSYEDSKDDGVINRLTFNCAIFEHAVRLWTTVLDISVSMASYPSREIAEGSYNYRTLGLGYANLGGLLAKMDMRYNSDAGRSLAAGVTALMTGVAYRTSAEIAAELGPFPRWEANAEPMRRVIQKHCLSIGKLEHGDMAELILTRAFIVWKGVLEAPQFRNAQVTLLAPTGTIRLIMDCETSGVEPFYARRETKQLAGGGEMEFYHPGVLNEDCAVPSIPGVPCLEPLAHVRMVAAVQPFLSGGVSKTVNLPREATVEDVDHVYREAHRLGLKSVAIYRDGSKLTQPVSAAVELPLVHIGEPCPDGPHRHTSSLHQTECDIRREIEWSDKQVERNPPPKMRTPELKFGPWQPVLGRGQRRELPSRRPAASRTKFELDGHSVYLSTGDHEDGKLAEIFLGIGKRGSDVGSWADSFCKAVSIGLQYGVPLEAFVHAFEGVRFEPAGIVGGDTRVRICKSLPDLVFRHLAIEYLGREDLASVPRPEDAEAVAQAAEEIEPALARASEAMPLVAKAKIDRVMKEIHTARARAAHLYVADVCPHCGTFGRMRRAGPCVTCTACGEDNGGCG